MNYIPLNIRRKSNFESMDPKRRRKPNTAFGGDKRILPRIKQLMSTYKVSKFIDEKKLIEDLQNKYPEYKRRKQLFLKTAIEIALQTLSEDGSDQEYKSEMKSSSSPNSECDKYRKAQKRKCNDLDNSDVSLCYEDERNGNVDSCMLDLNNCSMEDAEFKKTKEYVLETETVDNVHRQTNGNASDIFTSQIPVVRTKKLKDELVKSPKQCTRQAAEETIKKSKKNQKGEEKESKDPFLKYPTVTFSDIGGMEKTLTDLIIFLSYLKKPKIFQTLGVQCPCGVLFYGPPGCGKTLLAHAIAGELEFPILSVNSTELVSGVSGESEKKVRNLFDLAGQNSPCVLFIDEIDTIAPKRELAQKEMEKRIVSQLLKCMDDLNTRELSSRVLVIGATNRPDALDPSLRRAGRFDREMKIDIPDESARVRILQSLCKNLRLSPDFDFQQLAKSVPGYVGADLVSVLREATVVPITRTLEKYISVNAAKSEAQGVVSCLPNSDSEKDVINDFEPSSFLHSARSWLKDEKYPPDEEVQDMCIEAKDFKSAVSEYVPSLKREGFASIPSVTWEDVGAMTQVKETLQTAILWPLKYKKKYAKLKLTSPSGVLLWGPKGCGKTLIAKAVANECSINFLSVRGPELLNMFVGESERAVRQVFQRARNSAPCVIFFDEVDSLCPPRGGPSGNVSSDRVTNQMLTEISGMEPNLQVFVLAASNNIDNIDTAMLRPGRLETVVYVGLPTPEERVDILKSIIKNDTKLSQPDIESIGHDSRADGFSGSDLASLVKEARLKALKENLESNPDDTKEDELELAVQHFDCAFSIVRRSVSEAEIKHFERMRHKFQR